MWICFHREGETVQLVYPDRSTYNLDQEELLILLRLIGCKNEDAVLSSVWHCDYVIWYPKEDRHAEINREINYDDAVIVGSHGLQASQGYFRR